MLGTGTKENPYLVSTEDDLFDIRLNPLAFYKLTNDIYMTKWQTGEGWNPIPSFGTTASGVRYSINGDGHTIHDLYINRGGIVNVGFIAVLNAGEITNLHFKGVNIVGGGSTGTIVGKSVGLRFKNNNSTYVDYYTEYKSSIINCSVSGTIRGTQDDLGAVVGSSTVAPIFISCHVDMKIYAGGSNIGGIIGHAEGGASINGTRIKGNIYNGGSNVGGFIGKGLQGKCTIYLSYSLMDIQANNYIGCFIGYSDFNREQGFFANYVQESYFAGTLNFNKSSAIYVGMLQGWGVSGESKVLVDVEKLGFKNSDKSRVLYKINTEGATEVGEYTSAQMSNIITYIKEGFAYGTLWLEDGKSTTDTLKHISEMKNEDGSPLFTLKGAGTAENPYLIKNTFDLMAMERYDQLNWLAYNALIRKENDWNDPAFKSSYNFSSPTQFHYKLANDIDLNTYPFNETGWIPLFKREQTVRTRNGSGIVDFEGSIYDALYAPPLFNIYNSIGTIVGKRTLGRVLTTKEINEYNLADGGVGYVNKGFMGILNGDGHKIKNLKLKEFTTHDRISFIDLIGGGTIKDLNFESVSVSVDKYRENRSISVGVLAHTVLATSRIERVSISGQSNIKDYQADVGGQGSSVAGLVYSFNTLDNGDSDSETDETKTIFIGSKRYTNVKDCRVDITNTYSNAVIGDEVTGFYPLFYASSNAILENVYSSCSNLTTDRFNMPITGITGTHVLFGSVRGKNFTARYFNVYEGHLAGVYQTQWWNVSGELTTKLLNVYYDAQKINANVNSAEMPDTALRYPYYYPNASDIIGNAFSYYGRSTEAMKLQSTYVGWNFNRIWKADGIGYPTLQPYDANYVEPVNKTENIITMQVATLNFAVTKDGLNRNVEKIVVKSASRKFKGKTKTTRKGTLSPKTIVESINIVAFEYKVPVIGIQTVTTNVEILGFKVESAKARKRTNVLQTAVNGIGFKTEAVGINRGIYFDGIDIEQIGYKSILIKVNDPRIKKIVFNNSSYSIPQNKYITLRIDSALLTEGVNTLSIDGIASIEQLDATGQGTGYFADTVLFNRKVNVNKKTEAFQNRTGESIFINGEYYKIASHSINGTMTLVKNLATDVKRILENNHFNTLEVVGVSSIPQISMGERGHQKVYTTGQLLNVKRNADGIEEEYEFVGKGEEVATKIDFSRVLPPTDFYANKASSTGFSTAPSTDKLPMENLGGTVYKTERTMAVDVSGNASHMFQINVTNFIRKYIDATYNPNGLTEVEVKFRWYGKTYHQKETFAQASTDTATIFLGGTVTKYMQPVTGSLMKMSEMTTRTRNNVIDFEVMSQYGLNQYAGQDGARVVDKVGIETDYIEFDFLVKSFDRQATVLKEVRQVFIPLENNSKDL